MSIYSPYFYIIEHTPTGLKYAGCKFGKDAFPEKFMTEDGYQTSSTRIHELIRIDGLQSFQLVELLLEEHIGDVYEFETTFLRTNKIASDKNWINRHENHIAPFGSPEFKVMMMKIHGVENCSEIPGIRDKINKTKLSKYGDKNYNNRGSAKQTCVTRYGQENPMQVDDIKNKSLQTRIMRYGQLDHSEKMVKTNIERYGVTCTLTVPEVQEKVRQSVLERYGVEYASQQEEVKLKTRKTNIERYGVECVFQSPEVRDKITMTTLERYGVDHNMKCPEIKQRAVATCLERHGVEHPFQSKEIREKQKQTCIQKYGVDHHTKNKEVREKLSDGKKNTVAVFCPTTQKNMLIQKSNPEYNDYLHGKLVAVNKKFVMAFDGNQTIKVLKNDSRFLTREIELIPTAKK